MSPSPLTPPRAIEVTYLQMRSADELRLKPCPDASTLHIIEAQEPLPELNRFLYTAVGGDWYWVDRLPWTWAQWQAAIGGPNHRTFVCYSRGTPAGYYELHKNDDHSVEISYFGLMGQFQGRGIGGWLLSQCLADGWAWGANRIWVHTCALDHPAALHNYQARGLKPYDSETERRNLAAEPPGPWPGAQRLPR